MTKSASRLSKAAAAPSATKRRPNPLFLMVYTSPLLQAILVGLTVILCQLFAHCLFHGVVVHRSNSRSAPLVLEETHNFLSE